LNLCFDSKNNIPKNRKFFYLDLVNEIIFTGKKKIAFFGDLD